MNKVIIFSILLFPFASFGQYNPEMDIRGINVDDDGAEVQLANSDVSHLLRFFSGRGLDPNPFIYFADTDTFHLVSGGADNMFSNFTPRFTVKPNGYTGINNRSPEVELQISTFDPNDGSQIELINLDKSYQLGLFSGRTGNPNSIIYWHENAPMVFQSLDNSDIFTTRFMMDREGYHTPWNFRFKHNVDGWAFPSQIWMQQGWSGSLWDFIYLGATGNRPNDVQAGMILSHKKGIIFGKGSDSADQLTQEHVLIDTSGNVGICTDPNQKLDVNGKIRVSDDENVPTAGTIRYVDTTKCFQGFDGADWLPLSDNKYDTLVISGAAFVPEDGKTFWTRGSIFGTYGESGNDNVLNAPLLLEAGDTIINVTVFYKNDDLTNTMDIGVWASPLTSTGFLYSNNTLTTSHSATITAMSFDPNIRISGKEHYMLRVQPSPLNGSEWNTDKLLITGVQIVYSEK